MNKIKKLKKMIKVEFEVEILACVHAFVMIFAYAGETFFFGEDNINFLIILEMGCLSYLTAWVQRIVFRKEKPYKALEYKIRGIVWWVLPSMMILATGWMCQWFWGLPTGLAVFFYGLLTAYYIGLWFFLQIVYKEETQVLNKLLDRYKEEGSGSRKVH